LAVGRNHHQSWPAEREQRRRGLGRCQGNTDGRHRRTPQLLADLVRRAKQARQPANVEHHERSHHFKTWGEPFGDLD
jgi:hypothetical protein